METRGKRKREDMASRVTVAEGLFQRVMREVGDVIMCKLVWAGSSVDNCQHVIHDYEYQRIKECGVLFKSGLVSTSQCARVLGGCVDMSKMKRTELVGLAREAGIVGTSGKTVGDLKEMLRPLEVFSPSMYSACVRMRKYEIMAFAERGFLPENPLWLERIIKRNVRIYRVYKTEAKKYFKLPDDVLARLPKKKTSVWIRMPFGSKLQTTYSYRAAFLKCAARKYHAHRNPNKDLSFLEDEIIYECETVANSIANEQEFTQEVMRRHETLQTVWQDNGFVPDLGTMLDRFKENEDFGLWEYLRGTMDLEHLVSLQRESMEHGTTMKLAAEISKRKRRAQELRDEWEARGYQDSELLTYDMDETLKQKYPISWGYIHDGSMSIARALAARRYMQEQSLSIERFPPKCINERKWTARLSYWVYRGVISQAQAEQIQVPHKDQQWDDDATMDLCIFCYANNLDKREFCRRVKTPDLSLLFTSSPENHRNPLFHCPCGYYSGEVKMIRHVETCRFLRHNEQV
jgi:hypothetical protein